MRKILTDGFGGLHKNMNCTFPLNERLVIADTVFDTVKNVSTWKRDIHS